MKLQYLGCLVLASCRAMGSDPADALLAADRAFCADTQARRLEGWLAAFDVHGSQVGDDFRPITGHEAIGAHMGGFLADPRNVLLWEPDSARVSEGGRLGATTGRYELRYPAADGSGEIVKTGRYFDIWRRLPDGTWKLLYDVGDGDAALEQWALE